MVGGFEQMEAADGPPNFIVFYVDDLGWADTSVEMIKGMERSRSDFHQTPSLEKLARNGVVFSSAYSPAPTCTPSRISVTYGKTNAKLQYATVHDVAANNRGRKESIPKEHVSIPSMLKQAGLGYVTAHFGKGIAIAHPHEVGYDVDDTIDKGTDNGNYHGEFVNLAPTAKRVSLPEDNPKRIYSLTDTSVKFIEKQAEKKKPFFMFVSHYSAHVPHAASPHMIEKYRNLPRGKYCRDADYLDPKDMTESQRTCTWRLQYAAMVEETDISLGRIMDALEKQGIADNTYIVFTSDNGGGLTPNGALTGGKANLFEGGLRVPTVIAGPNMPKGEYCHTPIIQWDLLRTFHDLSGSQAPLPEGVEGGSLKSVFENPASGKVERPIPGLIFNYPYYAAAPINAIRIGDYKLMRQLNTNELRLFNVAKDLSEKENLAQTMPEKAAEMAQVMDKYLESVGAITIDEVYKAREEELHYFKNRAREDHQREMERVKKKSAPHELPAKIAKVDEKLQQRLKGYDRQINHLMMQKENTNFIGGNYKKK
jgi:arylsulfatase A-like enzyme